MNYLYVIVFGVLQKEGSKTIGIISHVEALKERINTQIRLKRSGQGFSTLAVQS